MKNKIYIIWLIWISLLLSPVLTYGESSTCNIQTEASQSLSDYIQNTRTAVININKTLLTKTSDKNDNRYIVAWRNISRIYNEAINWDWFYTDFKYYLTYPMSNEIPYQVQRDLNLLENETQWLRLYLETLVDKWYSWVELNKIEVCEGVKNCELEWSAIQVIWDIINNNTKITAFYKQVATQSNDSNTIDAILTYDWNAQFTKDLIQDYWNNQCSTIDNGFSERIDAAIDAILLNNEQWKEWIAKWSESWKLLIWASSNYDSKEHDLLAKELSRQWLSSNAQSIMLDNLKNFNQDWYVFIKDNFIENSFKQLVSAWWEIVNWFSEATKWLLSSQDTQDINNTASVWINTLLNNTDIINTNDSIKKRLANLKASHTINWAIETSESQKIQADIIKMLAKITNSSEVLKETCELAVKVCNDQWNGKWNCWTCK